MKRINPAEISLPELHGNLLSSIGPRPIALASTVDADGKRNLSPFSFFNVFSANPPIAIFSPARRGKDNTTKHTYENVKVVPEVVINVVSFDMVQQVSLSSTEYDRGVDEFIKAGFTPIESDLVKPARVAESPVQLECKVNEVVELGKNGGAGNLIISEIVMIHIDKSILDDEGKIDQYKIDLVGRMGKNWYSRSRNGLFEVEKPLSTIGMGIDGLPQLFRNSEILTGNDLGMLGNVEERPSMKEVYRYKDEHLKSLLGNAEQSMINTILHQEAHNMLLEGKVTEAWKILMSEGIE